MDSMEHVVRLERMRLLRSTLPILTRIYALCEAETSCVEIRKLLYDVERLLFAF